MTTTDTPTIGWLMDSDPSIRWQAMRDLLDVPESQWQAERATVETQGWGARLLGHQDADGQWAGGAFFPSGFRKQELEAEGQPWTATSYSLTQLREFGLDPASAAARRAVAGIGVNCRWDHDGQPFWDGEVEECINGRVVADGAYFGVDVAPIVDRLTGERLDDGGWNCERATGSVRSSFDTTVNVLEGLLEHERATGGSALSREARRSGEEFLLARHLSGGSARANRPTRDSCPCPTPPDGGTTSCAGWTISGAPVSSPVQRPIRGSTRPSSTSARNGWPTAPGRWRGTRAGGSGSTSTTVPVCPHGG